MTYWNRSNIIFSPNGIAPCRYFDQLLILYEDTTVRSVTTDHLDMSTTKVNYVEDLEGYQIISAVACCELIPLGLTTVNGDFDFIEDFLYDSENDQHKYPSASASYSENDCEQNFVNLLDTDFLDIYDELAKEDDRFEFGPSPVAMPIIYTVLEAEFISSGIITSIQHATLIESGIGRELPNVKESTDDLCFRNDDIMRSSIIKSSIPDLKDELVPPDKQKGIRNLAIVRWKKKKNQNVHKSVSNCAKSARQEATARRPRSHGKFNKVKAKWVVATEYFQSGLSHERVDEIPATGCKLLPLLSGAATR